VIQFCYGTYTLPGRNQRLVRPVVEVAVHAAALHCLMTLQWRTNFSVQTFEGADDALLHERAKRILTYR
jgi:hypothetical protein